MTKIKTASNLFLIFPVQKLVGYVRNFWEIGRYIVFLQAAMCTLRLESYATMDNHCIELLEHHGIKPTANRILVLEAMMTASHSMSLSDIETALETVDKSSIFRTLNLFRQQQLVHSFEDGSGSEKYEIIGGGGHAELHTHFYCESCHETYCLKMINVPSVDLPDGFEVRSVNYTIKGICDKCSKKQRML